MTARVADALSQLVSEGALFDDPDQRRAAQALDALLDELSRRETARKRLFSGRGDKSGPSGAYLYGPAGRGKSMLMEFAFERAPVREKRRIHFHEFMAEAHDAAHAWRAMPEYARKRHPDRAKNAIDDPTAPAARAVTRGATLLAFDEFEVRDIADAMILGRLFDTFDEDGVTVIATSNRPPDDLYKDGLNRQLFMPFIERLKARFAVLEVAGQRDFRADGLAAGDTYWSPITTATRAAFDAAWRAASCGARAHRETLDVLGRAISVPAAWSDTARFDFSDLAERALGARDFLAIARRYGVVFIENVPRIPAERRDQAKRFALLIDALYEARAKVVILAEEEPDALYGSGDYAFEFARTASRLKEMRSVDYLRLKHTAPTEVEAAAE